MSKECELCGTQQPCLPGGCSEQKLTEKQTLKILKNLHQLELTEKEYMSYMMEKMIFNKGY